MVGNFAQVLDVPSVRLEAGGHVVAVGERGVAVDGDVVVVVHTDQVAQVLVASERRRLVADAFHEAAITGDDERVVVDDVGAELATQVPLGECHSDGIGEALAERTGGHLHAGGVADLGVARSGRAPLAELFDVVEREPVAGEEQQRVLQDRRVAVGQDEPVAVRPVRVGRIVPHDPAVEHVGEGSEGHGRALVATLGGERCVHGEATDERNGLLVEFWCEAVGHGIGLYPPHRAASRTRDRSIRPVAAA